MKLGRMLMPAGYLEHLKQLPYPDALPDLEEAAFSILKKILPPEVNVRRLQSTLIHIAVDRVKTTRRYFSVHGMRIKLSKHFKLHQALSAGSIRVSRCR
jgi:hypothetical protein